jgi:hypothetical protein
MIFIMLSLILFLLIYDRCEKIIVRKEEKRRLEEKARERIADETRKFLMTETKLIEIAKWIESEKCGKDLSGNDFVSAWIKNYATEVRTAWNNSKCRSCQKDCRYKLKTTCPDYTEDPALILF